MNVTEFELGLPDSFYESLTVTLSKVSSSAYLLSLTEMFLISNLSKISKGLKKLIGAFNI